MAINPDAALSRGDLLRRIDNLERRLRNVETGRSLEAASIGRGGLRVRNGFIEILDEDGIVAMRLSTAGLSLEGILAVVGSILLTGDQEVIGTGEIRSETFDGDTADGDAGSRGWALGNDRLALRGAFAEAVEYLAENDFESNFAIPAFPDLVVGARMTIQVPSWAQQAAVTAVMSFAAQNGTANPDTFAGEPRIHDDTSATAAFHDVDPGFIQRIVIAHSSVVDTSNLNSFNIDGVMQTTNADWPADPDNSVTISAMVAFSSATL